MESTTNDAGMIPYLVVYEKIGNDPLLISNVETDMSRLSNELHNTDDVFVVTESHRKYDIRCNRVHPSSSEIRSLGVEEMNKKSALCKLERLKEKLMACKEAKLPVRTKRKYAAILQQDTRAKLMKEKRISWLRIQSNTSKEGKTLMKQLKRILTLRIQSKTSKEEKP